MVNRSSPATQYGIGLKMLANTLTFHEFTLPQVSRLSMDNCCLWHLQQQSRSKQGSVFAQM